MIIGTAGHIDHGKSSLVEVLTGRQMDRLAEERARGITIDLNFAPLRLPDGTVLGVVDVPGHEDFVRTMVAGAAGIDLVLLVVAADEGIMPQTREHRAVVESMCVPVGIPVLTKCDLVDPEWAALVREDVDAWLADSPVAFGQCVAASARTRSGIEALQLAIINAVPTVPVRDREAPFRLPVDRAFSMAGTGTVVTGSIWSGAIATGDQLRLLPSDTAVRVRSIEVHGERVDRAHSGSRAAVGLANIDRQAVGRGDVLVDSALPWNATSALDVRLDVLPSAPRPLTSRTRVHLHLGTAEVLARVLPRAPIAPGESGLARLACEEPLLAAGGDRFVIRSYSPVTTIGGGVVLDPLPPRRRARWPAGLDSDDPAQRLLALLERHHPVMSSGLLALMAGVSAASADHWLAGAPWARRLPGGWVLTSEVTAAREKAVPLVTKYHADHPSLPGIPAETLRRAMHRTPAVAEAALADLVGAAQLHGDGGAVRLRGFSPKVAGGQAAVEEVLGVIRMAGLGAPSVRELEVRLSHLEVRGALRAGVENRRVEAVSGEWYVDREALQGFEATLRAAGAEGEITVAGLRERTGLSRKYLIPLLEWADRTGITRREGEGRRLT